MVKQCRVVVAGAKEAGKTAILHQLALLNDITGQPYEPTLDDTYTVTVEREKGGARDTLVFHDTAGLGSDGPNDLRRAYLVLADAFLLVYDVGDEESFNRVDQLKRSLDRHAVKEKKEVPILVLGNKTDAPNPVLTREWTQAWANRERDPSFEVIHYQVSAKDRSSLVDPIVALAQRLFHPQKESKFTLPKRQKDKPSDKPQIVMDI